MVSARLKTISQNGNHSQVGVKIKNIWNHHLVLYTHVFPTHEKGATKPWVNSPTLETSVSSPLKTMMTSSRALTEQASGGRLLMTNSPGSNRVRLVAKKNWWNTQGMFAFAPKLGDIVRFFFKPILVVIFESWRLDWQSLVMWWFLTTCIVTESHDASITKQSPY